MPADLMSGALTIYCPVSEERPRTKRICVRFYHAEAEIRGGIDDMMAMVESYVRRLTLDIVSEVGPTVDKLTGGLGYLDAILDRDDGFPQITVDEAVALLKGYPDLVRHHHEGFRTITRAGERRLIEQHGGVVWLTKQDHMAVPFYQRFVPGDDRLALASDLLFGLGEVAGSGERHREAADVKRALTQHEVDSKLYEWYMEMCENKPLLTSGFGLGSERYIAWLLNHDDIRDL